MMYYRQNRGPRNPRSTDPQNPNSEGKPENAPPGNRAESRPDSRPDNRSDNRPDYGNRDNRPPYNSRPREGRPPYDRDNRPSGDRDNRPSYGNSDNRPSYGNRDNRPPYQNRDARPPYQNRDSRPSYGDRDNRPGGDRPSYGNRDARPPYQNRDSRPSYGDRDNRPPYQNRDSRPSYGDRDRRPSYGDRDRRPSYGDRDRRPSYGDRDRRPSYGDRRGGPSRGPVKDNRISLPRAIARLGFTSRNLAIDIIKQGRVRVDDRVVNNPSVRLTPMRNNIYVDDVCINTRHPRTYIIMHKPKGLVTSREDIAGRKTIYSVLPNKHEWYFPIGRLDKNTSGLLILTNDPFISNPETSPFNGMERTYTAKLNKLITPADLKKLTSGLPVLDGKKLKPVKVNHLRDNKHTSWIELTLTEGRNTHVRKMFKALGYELLTLMRTKIGEIPLGELPIGSWKELTAEEITTLFGGKLPSHFESEPTETEIKIASGEIVVKNDKTKAKEKKALAAIAHATGTDKENTEG